MVDVQVFPQQSGEKVADAQLVFTSEAGLMAGLKLVGFEVWRRRSGELSVTFPARQYSVNGERRSFAVLRPAGLDDTARVAVRNAILDAYRQSVEG